MLDKYSHIIFSDGSSLGNPGNGGYGAIIINEHTTVTEIGGREDDTTNNRMELSGLLHALRTIETSKGQIICCTDSQYVINCVSKWIPNWKKNNWITSTKTPVLNRDLLEQIDEIVHAHKKIGEVHFRYVPGHVGVAGNERCDEIATSFARGETPELFSGTLSDYAVDTLNIGVDEDEAEKRARTKTSSAKAYSYLSLVDGIALRHTTWADCEKRVKGQSKVKFKKSISKEDEEAILKSWGAKLSN